MRIKGFEANSLQLGMDWTMEDFNKYQILVESTWGYSHPCSFHLKTISDNVMKGVYETGGKPAYFNTTDMCDGIAQGHDGMRFSLLSRDMISYMVEIHFRAHPFDGLVLVSGSDKALPGHLMALARLNYPSVHVPGGVMDAGCNLTTLEQIGMYHTQLVKNKISNEELSWKIWREIIRLF